MLKARLNIIYPDDIKTVYCQLLSKSPLRLNINEFSETMTADALEMMLQWHEGNSARCVQVEYLHMNGEDAVFRILKDMKGNPSCSHRVEYKGSFDIRKISKEEYPACVREAARQNTVFKSSVVSRIHAMLPSETNSNQHMFRLLLEMDSKLDRLLYLAEDKRNKGELTTVNALYLSGDGCGFFSEERVEEGDNFYLEARSFDTSGKLRFVSVGRVVRTRKTDKGVLADFVFEELEEAIKENIIRYVFEKDRELLKGAKEK
jgi:hypothetical protein